jgi:[acyl-carrier-protein] S-malonyltransferase
MISAVTDTKITENLAFLFPGQGSQYVGMGKHLYEDHAPSRKLFTIADEVLGLPLSTYIFEGPEGKLKETEITQPALLTLSVAIGRYLMENGIIPTVLAGHSLGEYSALVIADSIDFETAVELVRYRGQYMQAAVPAGQGTMSAILGLEDDEVDAICAQVRRDGEVVEAAAYNCPGQVVVAGAVAAVKRAGELAKEKDARVIPLKVSAPFHCSMLQPAADQLLEHLNKIKFRHPKIPYFANVDANVVTEAGDVVQRLTDQVCKPVRWTQSLRNIFMTRTQRFIEAGPGKVCVGHLKKVERRKDDRAAVFAITDKEPELKEVLSLFG